MEYWPWNLDRFHSLNVAVQENQVNEIHSLTLPPKVDRNTAAPFDLCVKTAQRIYEDACDPLVLCVSGGLDSQALLAVFLAARVPFEMAIMKFEKGLNAHDIDEAFDRCLPLSHKLHVYEIDIIDFFESGQFYDFALAARTNSPQFAAHCWLADQIQGFPVFSGQPWQGKDFYNVDLNPDANSDVASGIQTLLSSQAGFYLPEFREYAVTEYLRAKGRAGLSHFFECQYELVNSFLKVKDWFCQQTERIESPANYRAKLAAYRQSGFPLTPTQRGVKLTGFERVLAYYAIRYESEDIYYFNKLFRHPLEKHFPRPNQVTLRFYEGDELSKTVEFRP